MYKCFLDFETYSELDLKKVGSHRYASHPSTGIHCLAFKQFPSNIEDIWLISSFNDVNSDWRTWREERALCQLAAKKNVIFVAHNAAFEMDIWEEIMVKRYGYPEIPIERWKCTMAKAQACGLPAGLGSVAKVLQLPAQKDMEGNKSMLFLSKPNRQGKFWDSEEKPEDFKNLYRYCQQDVAVEMQLDARLPDLSAYEQRVWVLNEKINRRGVRVNVPLVNKVISLSNAHKKLLGEKFQKITGENFKPTQRKKFQQWLSAQGFQVADTKSTTLEKLKGEKIEGVVSLFLASNKSSLAKYKAMVNRVSPDNKLRGITAYHAAHTGRFGGRGVQLQNLPRTSYPMALLHKTLEAEDYDWLALLYGLPAHAMSSAIRGMFIPDDGFEFIVGDLSGIEARVLAWLAGQTDKLERFEQGVDPYVHAAKDIYPKGTVITKDRRFVGKTAELALGYKGGIGAYVKMGNTNRVDLTPICKPLWETATYAEREHCRHDYMLYVKRCELAKVQPCSKLLGYVCSLIKSRWRRANPRIVLLWRELEACAVRVIASAESETLGRLSLSMHDIFFVITLPSGRSIRYPYPKLHHTKRGAKISYRTVDSITKQWVRTTTYGGALTENIVQAISRDILVDAMLKLDEEKHDIKFHVHDEAIIETNRRTYTPDDLASTLSAGTIWSKGLPINAECFRTKQYEKR